MTELITALKHDAVINKLDVLSIPASLEVRSSEGSLVFELSEVEICINSDKNWGPSKSIMETKLENSKVEIQMQSGLKIRIS